MAIVTEKINRDKVEKQAYDFFTNAGLTPEHAAGVVGNLMYESMYGNHKAVGDNGNAYGLAQWQPDRQRVFKKVYGKDIRNSSVEEQLGFVLYELKNTHKKAYNTLLTTSSPMQAGQAISDLYEAPKTKFSLNKDRQLAVANVYKKYVNNSYNPMPTLSEKITSAGDIVRATMGNLFPQNVSENTPEINATDKKEVVNAEDEIKTKQNTEDQRLLQLNNIISTIDTAYNKPIDKLNNQEYTTPYLEVPKLSYAEAEQLATQGMMQQGGRVDMYGTHLNSNIVPLNSDRSYYDSRLNTVRTGRDFENMSPDSRDRLIAHENFHAKQFKEGRSNFDIAHDTEDRQWAEMQKRPSLPSTDEEYYNYHNRKAKEVEIDIQNVKNRLPETSFFPNAANSIIFNKIVDSNQYDNPYSLEGEAQYYENTGREFDTKQQGGVIKDNMGQWKFPGQITQIDSNNITMKPNPINGEPIKNNILGIDNLGNIQIMKPNKDYTFKGNTVTEYPMLQQGGKPIYVESQNDPRYIAYQDSLNLYNKAKIKEDKFRRYSKIDDLKIAKQTSDDFLPTSHPKIAPTSRFGFLWDNKKGYVQVNKGHTNEAITNNAKNFLKGNNYIRGFAEEYKKPQQPVIVQRPDQQSIKNYLKTQGIQYDTNFAIQPQNTDISQQAQIPKYFNVVDKVNQTFGGSETNYKWYPDNNTPLPSIAPEPYNTRVLTPVYQQGGKTDYLKNVINTLSNG